MTPAARLAAVIELVAALEADRRPADSVAADWLRQRRYIGAKDRAAITERFYALLRRRLRLEWWLARLDSSPGARALVLADAILVDGPSGEARADAVAGLFNGARFGPEPLDEAERRLARALDSHTLHHPEMPEAVALECPAWAEPGLRAALGARFAPELAALIPPAPLDLRANRLKATREEALAALAAAGIVAVPTPLSPDGIRVAGRPPLSTLPVFRDGLVEVQDEGSQLAALLVDARPGQAVLDLCAGAGGKTLALAAQMDGRGRLLATDPLANRLERARLRLRRAGAHNVEARPLDAATDRYLKRHRGGFDRVLVDAPCTGTGTWRRNPDARWRRAGPDLAELLETQARLLDRAARLVRPGGRLVYVTCSLLAEENEGQIAALLTRVPGLSPLPAAPLWAERIGQPWPGAPETPWLRLTPAHNGTDGFFAAVLEKAPVAEAADG